MLDEGLLADVGLQLSDIQETLLEYERATQGHSAVTHRDLLYLLMRRAHSLKGNLRLADRSVSAGLVHQMESLLVRYLDLGKPMATDAIDLTFDSLDMVTASLLLRSEDIRGLQTLGRRSELLLVNLNSIVPAVRKFPFPVAADQYSVLEQARLRNEKVFCIEKAIRSDIAFAAFQSLPIFDDVCAVGQLVAYHPSFERMERSRAESVVTLVVTTSRSAEEIDANLFDPWGFCEWPEQVTVSAETTRTPPVSEAERRRLVCRILVVEDDATSRLLLSGLLKGVGTCDSACDGREAITEIRRALDAGAPYELVCLDIMLPEFDGYHVLKELRRLEEENGLRREARAKVVMTTALSDYEHFHRAFAHECDSYLVKPITKAALMRQLIRLEVLPAG